MQKIYLDYAASTPVDRQVLAAMTPYFSEKFGNPSSLHSFGQEASAAVDEARAKVARVLGLDPLAGFREIIFTGSATEANNLALRGIAKRIMNNELRNGKTVIHNSEFIIPRIIVSAIEHESILATARDLEKDGIDVVFAPVNKYGAVDLAKFRKLLNERTVLVSVMLVNNETGTVQPIAEIAKIIRDFREVVNARNVISVVNNKSQQSRNAARSTTIITSCPLLHVDASQAPHVLDYSPARLGVDLVTLSGHKIYGPKGIGVLYTRNVVSVLSVVNEKADKTSRASTTPTTFISPVLTGAHQEFGLRAGTENVPGIIGFAKALELAAERRKETVKKLEKLQEIFCRGVKKIYPRAQFNGANPLGKNPAGTGKSPHIVNIYFPGRHSHDLLVALDMVGVAVSSGSACSSRHSEPSYILRAMGCSQDRARSSLRFSFGRPTTAEEIKKTLVVLKNILGK